jgi:3-hydroxymyristoyl/3-hydroxydecanoyl-(acyl carrier protein) dehydratase
MSTEPIVIEQRVTPTEASLQLAIPLDIAYVAGHFPDAPIVPGVVQLKWAIDRARSLLAVAGDLRRIEALKFQQVMVPGAFVTLTLKWAPADRKLSFAYQSSAARFSSGRLLFRSEQ